MTESKPEANPVRTRNAGTLDVGEDAWVSVDHVFPAEGAASPCDHEGCKAAHNAGMVSLTVFEDSETAATVALDPAEALLLANRLTRGANMALESQEAPPDLEREAARWNSEREAGKS